MEVVIDFETLPGAHNEPVIKELAIAAKDVVHTYHFQAPYYMPPHGSVENGLNWDEGSVEYNKLETVLRESVLTLLIYIASVLSNVNSFVT
jgi:hypothetical protein